MLTRYLLPAIAVVAFGFAITRMTQAQPEGEPGALATGWLR